MISVNLLSPGGGSRTYQQPEDWRVEIKLNAGEGCVSLRLPPIGGLDSVIRV